MDKEHQGICQICLRIDKLVHKTRHHNLIQFYNEICQKASDIELPGTSPQCCVECEQRLRKMYNFKEQCVSATNILDGWRTMKSGPKQPLHSIHKSLTKSSLEIWTPEKNAVFCYQHGSNATIIPKESRKIITGPKVEQSENVIPEVKLIKNVMISRPEDRLNKNIIITRPEGLNKNITITKPQGLNKNLTITRPGGLNKNIIITRPKLQANDITSRPIQLYETKKPVVQLTKPIIISKADNQLSKIIPKSESAQYLYIPIEGLSIPRTLSTLGSNVIENQPTPISSPTKGPVLCSQDILALNSVKKEDPVKNEPINDCDDSDVTHSGNNSLHEEYLEESSIKSDHDLGDTYQSEVQNTDGENCMESDNETFPSEFENRDVENCMQSNNDDMNNTFKSELQNTNSENCMESDNGGENETFHTELENRDVENCIQGNNDDSNTYKSELQNANVEYILESDTGNLTNTLKSELQNANVEYIVENYNGNLNIRLKAELQQYKDVENSIESNNDDLNNTFQLQNRDVDNSMESNNDDLNKIFQCELQNSDVADDYTIMSNESDHSYVDDNDNLNETLQENETQFENKYFGGIEHSPQKRSLAELANISLSRNDFTDEDSKEESYIPRKKRKIQSESNDQSSESNTDKRSFNKEFFSKESLKECLAEIFERCGEIKKGEVVIDKDFILSLLDGKMSQKKMITLWGSIYGRDTIGQQAFFILKNIQNSYQNAEYEHVFDIIYLKTEEEMYQEFQNRQTYKCYTDAEYKCDICYRGFQNQHLLAHHQKYHDVSSGDIVCRICNKRFHQEATLKSHRVIHTTVFKCKLCPLVTNYRSTMVNHYGQHMGYNYKCDVCESTFRSSSALNTHTSKCHPSQHICTRCGRAFTTALGLQTHNAKLHQNQDPLGPEEANEECPHCGLWFLTREAVIKHIGISHNDTAMEPGQRRQRRPRTASDPSKDALKTPVECRACNAVGRDRKWLNSHFLSDHPLLDVQALYPDVRKHLCDICGKGYCNKYAMLNHMGKHTATRVALYECSECSKRFATKPLLRVHLLTHRPPQKKCNVCGKKFVSDANLLCHKRIHTGDRRYKCHHCGKGFLYPGAVREHIKGVHQKIRRNGQKRSPSKVVTETLEYPDVGSEVIWEDVSTEYLEVS